MPSFVQPYVQTLRDVPPYICNKGIHIKMYNIYIYIYSVHVCLYPDKHTRPSWLLEHTWYLVVHDTCSMIHDTYHIYAVSWWHMSCILVQTRANRQRLSGETHINAAKSDREDGEVLGLSQVGSQNYEPLLVFSFW